MKCLIQCVSRQFPEQKTDDDIRIKVELFEISLTQINTYTYMVY